jgi:guanylate kinase
MRYVVILCAPSGAGKTTILKHLLHDVPTLAFSVSATTRAPRAGEVDGVDYHFLTLPEFKRRAINDEFMEWEEVYPDKFYGTLHSEMERLWSQGKQVLFEVDIYGGLSLKDKFGSSALLIFIMPPSEEELQRRLEARGTESAEIIAERMKKAREEMALVGKCDVMVINEDLETAIAGVRSSVERFIENNGSIGNCRKDAVSP